MKENAMSAKSILNSILNSRKALGLTMVFGAAIAAYNGSMIDDREAQRDALVSMTPEQIHKEYRALCTKRTVRGDQDEIISGTEVGAKDMDIPTTLKFRPRAPMTMNCIENEQTVSVKSAATALGNNKAMTLFGIMFAGVAFGGMVFNARRNACNRTENKDNHQPKP